MSLQPRVGPAVRPQVTDDPAPTRGAVPASTGPGEVATFEGLRASAATRLAPHCRGLTPELFDELVTSVARFRERWPILPPTGAGSPTRR